MEQKEFLTIKEFAEVAGVSSQSVYKRLNSTLKPYLSIKNGKKYLNIKALELYSDTDDKDNFLNENDQLATNNNQLIQLLKDELEAKNKQIEKLQSLLEQSQVNLSQAQYRLQMIEEKQMQEQSEADQTEQEPVKKTWWQKLFG